MKHFLPFCDAQVLCLTHSSLLLDTGCPREPGEHSSDCLQGRESAPCWKTRSTGEHKLNQHWQNQPSCPVSPPGKLHSAQIPFPKEIRDTATWQPSLTEKIIYLVFLSRESLVWINSTNSYHHLNTGQPVLYWGLDHLFSSFSFLLLAIRISADPIHGVLIC